MACLCNTFWLKHPITFQIYITKTYIRICILNKKQNIWIIISLSLSLSLSIYLYICVCVRVLPNFYSIVPPLSGDFNLAWTWELIVHLELKIILELRKIEMKPIEKDLELGERMVQFFMPTRIYQYRIIFQSSYHFQNEYSSMFHCIHDQRVNKSQICFSKVSSHYLNSWPNSSLASCFSVKITSSWRTLLPRTSTN